MGKRRNKSQVEAGTCVSGKHDWVEGQQRCTECKREALYQYEHRRYHEDPEYRKRKSKMTRNARLKRIYNSSTEEYNFLLKEQNFVCAICQNDCPTGKRLAIDHDHDTGKIRGLLCVNCNRGLSGFTDSTKLLTIAIKYLEGGDNE